jgi:hypothetical protein
MSLAQKRKYLRVRPDFDEFCLIDLKDKGQEFNPSIGAFIVNESPMGGCSLVIHQTEALQEGDQCIVQLGRMAPLRAEVKWRKEVDSELIRVGLELLE